MARSKDGLNRKPDLNRGLFNITNRGVKSCTLNLKQPQGIEIFKKLVKISDIVITNLSPRVMPGWGLDYVALKEVKPDIILISLPAFGSTGPDKDYVSYASTIEAAGGLSVSFGYPGRGILRSQRKTGFKQNPPIMQHVRRKCVRSRARERQYPRTRRWIRSFGIGRPSSLDCN